MEGPSLRRYLRLPLAEKIRVKTKKGRFTVRPGEGDLSMGGVFIDGRTLPLGTPVEVTIEARQPIHAKGQVRFVVKGLAGSSSERRKGIGIEFTELSARDLARLEDLVARTPWP